MTHLSSRSSTWALLVPTVLSLDGQQTSLALQHRASASSGLSFPPFFLHCFVVMGEQHPVLGGHTHAGAEKILVCGTEQHFSPVAMQVPVALQHIPLSQMVLPVVYARRCVRISARHGCRSGEHGACSLASRPSTHFSPGQPQTVRHAWRRTLSHTAQPERGLPLTDISSKRVQTSCLVGGRHTAALLVGRRATIFAARVGGWAEPRRCGLAALLVWGGRSTLRRRHSRCSVHQCCSTCSCTASGSGGTAHATAPAKGRVQATTRRLISRTSYLHSSIYLHCRHERLTCI